jgi:hypothetical protein
MGGPGRVQSHPSLTRLMPAAPCAHNGPTVSPLSSGGAGRVPPARGTLDGAQRPDNATRDAKSRKPFTSPAGRRGAGCKPDRSRMRADALRGEGAGGASAPGT